MPAKEVTRNTMNIEDELQEIKARNVRVEADKAWETSHFRKIIIVAATYFLVFLLMLVIGVEKPYLGALVPTLGFYVSTLSLEFAKSFWLEKIHKK